MSYNYREFHFYHNADITATKKTYTRTESGKSWKSKPEKVEVFHYSSENYHNYITSIPFFNNFGGRAYCRAHWGYENYGYIPNEVTTVSPDGEKKIVMTFDFE